MGFFTAKLEKVELPPQSPAFLVDKNDSLYVQWLSSVAVNILIRGRILLPNNEFAIIDETILTLADRVATSKTISLPRGFILTLTLDTVDDVRDGQCFCNFGIIRGGIVHSYLGNGYLTRRNHLTYPPAHKQSSLDGQGMIRSVLGTDPAVNVEVGETVPTNARWKFKGLKVTLVTDANVANRSVMFYLNDGTNVLWNGPIGPDQAESTTRVYYLICADKPNETAFDGFYTIKIYLPKEFQMMFQGWKVYTVTTNRQATDNWGAPRMDVEEWIEE